MSDCSFLELSGGKRLAYTLSEGKLPGVVFLSGFKSDMTGTKATAMEEICRRMGRRYLRFDYSGHGRSSGVFEQGTIGEWTEDVLSMLDQVAKGDNILLGSSMGGWLMLLAALKRPKQVRGLLGIASAPDFTEKLIWEKLSNGHRQDMDHKGFILVPDCYGGEPYPVTRRLIEEGRNHLLLHSDIPLAMPVRLLHGNKDEDVPYQISVQLMERLHSTNVRMQLVKDAGHRLSEPEHLRLLEHMLQELTAII